VRRIPGVHTPRCMMPPRARLKNIDSILDPVPAYPLKQHLEEPGPKVDWQARLRTCQHSAYTQRPEHGQVVHKVVRHLSLPVLSLVLRPSLFALRLVIAILALSGQNRARPILNMAFSQAIEFEKKI
jgi:hypothetical protein